MEGTPGADQRLCSLERTTAGWHKVKAVVDSGAEETVTPPGLLPGRVEESPMQRAGGRYRAANGARLPNLGQQLAEFRTPEGHGCSLRFQVAGVERPLVSVSQLARTGHRVEFGAREGWIVHEASGRRIRLQRSGGVYLLEMQVRDAGATEAKHARAEGTARSAAGPARMEGTARSAAGFSRPR